MENTIPFFPIADENSIEIIEFFGYTIQCDNYRFCFSCSYPYVNNQLLFHHVNCNWMFQILNLIQNASSSNIE